MGLHERHAQGNRRRWEGIAAEIGGAPAASRRTSRANAAGRTEAAWATGALPRLSRRSAMGYATGAGNGAEARARRVAGRSGS
eukprot:gene14543-10394_t